MRSAVRPRSGFIVSMQARVLRASAESVDRTTRGMACGLAAAVQMVLARTTVIPRNTPERLVTGGLFSFSRNPIYLADVVILSGLMLIWHAVLAAPLIAVFMAVITRRFIRGEEAAIAAAHGADYAAYCARTPRFLPWPRPRAATGTEGADA